MSETMTHAKGVFARGDGDALAPGVGALGEAAGAAGGFWRCGTGVRVGHGSGRGGVLGGRAAPVGQWVAPASPRSASLDTKPADTYISWPSGVAAAAGHARQRALMLRGGSGTHRGRGGLRRVQRGWDGPGGPVRAWTAGSWNTWRALARGETLRRVRRVEREMLSWLLVYYLFCIGGAAIGSPPRHITPPTQITRHPQIVPATP